MRKKITVTVNGRKLLADPGNTLAQITGTERPCGGHGKCGKCKMIAAGALSQLSEAEQRLLTKDEIQRGVRLSCLTHVLGDCEVETLFPVQKTQIVTEGILPKFERPIFSNYGIAMDIGTTTLAARLYGPDGSVLAEASCLNPQSQWGADVISRIEAAMHGEAQSLTHAIQSALNGMILDLSAAVGSENVDYVVITGNTVMLSLLVGQSVEPFSHAPFEATRLFGEIHTADALSLSALLPDTPVYLPPCIGAFVGADITCAILAAGLCQHDTAMLADIGTNGELALWHKGCLTVCATAAGPAFEGVGISMGMRGEAGAIDKVELQNGTLYAHVIGGAEPKGICGSGLVDAAACLLDNETVDESGYMEGPVVIKEPVTLTAKDIRMLQLAKSAICAGALTLLDEQDAEPAQVRTLYIAGGFGNYLNKESAGKIGLLPQTLVGASRTVGNAALSGAAMLLLDPGAKAKAETISKIAHVLDLTANAVFADHYMSAMIFDEI